MTKVEYELLEKQSRREKSVAFIMGWGNTLQDRWLDWLRERAREKGWSLLIIQIPVEYTSFHSVLAKIETLLTKKKCEIIFCHSMGALFGRYVGTHSVRRKIYLSPFWKIPKRTLFFGSHTLSRLLLRSLKWCKIPLLYRNFRENDVGVIDLPEASPRFISPATMFQVIEAQRQLPAMAEDDVTIFCPEDRVVDTSICEGITFEGGHLAFCVEDREKIFEHLAGLIESS